MLGIYENETLHIEVISMTFERG